MSETEIQQEILTVGHDATALVVTDNQTYLQAGELLTGIKSIEKRVKEYFKPLKESAHKAWRGLCERENEEIIKLTPAINHLNKQMTAYNIEQERIRKAEEERLRKEAEKAEEERRLQEALQAEKEGRKEEAEAVLNEPIYVPPPIVPKAVPKVGGQTMVDNWVWRVTDINKVPRQYLTINETAVNQVVRGLKGNANITGIEIYNEPKMRSVRG